MTDEEILKKLEPLLLQLIAALRELPEETNFDLEEGLTFLKDKNVPAHLNTASEIRKEKVRQLLMNYPKANKKKIAAQTGMSLSGVYLVWSNLKAQGRVK